MIGHIIVDYWILWVLGFMVVGGGAIILVGNFKNMINLMIDNKLDQLPPYPKISIRYDITDIEAHFEFPYTMTGTCNEIDYISHRFRGHPTPFEIDRFRHHCIYEYEKSGKSKVSDYKEYEK